LATRSFDSKWTIQRLLSEGGQAHTFLVREAGNEAAGDFVLKRLKNKNRINRFRHEVRAGLQLEHPNIVRIVEHNLEASDPYIVTPFYPRGELSAKLLQGKTLLERLRFFLGICEGVAHAHEHGVIHHDLKPANIFIADDGAPVVGDFGLCFIDDAGERFTLLDEAVGARWFMAPELASGRAPQVRPACDVYSLGKLLYWILAGRIFDRERHREPDWDLNPGQTDPDLTLVYETLDQLIVVDLSQRHRRVRSVMQTVQGVIERIQKRRRTYELASTPYCHQEHHHLRLASFRPGSVVTMHFVNPPGREVLEFGACEGTLAAWGRRRRKPDQLGDNLEIMICRSLGDFRSVVSERSATIWQVRAKGYPTLAFSASGDPVVAVLENLESGMPASLSTMRADGTNRVVETRIANDVSAPRSAAIALGPKGETAIYVGTDSSAAAHGTRSEIFFHKGNALERTRLPQSTNFPSALAYDQDGRLHHVYVISATAERRETRSLVHRWREPNGVWRDEIVASAHAGPMSAHIGFALTPDGLPVVLSDWCGESGSRSLVCHEMGTDAWRAEPIDLTPFSSEFGLLGITAGGTKQILVDRQGNKHIAVYSDTGGSRNILYLAVHRDFTLIERRVFPAQAFIGMGIDGLETVYVATL
jgi:tRNA A-37 threonylcarbamoyl transferase component Bud32